jgi:outer membrane protein TolC
MRWTSLLLGLGLACLGLIGCKQQCYITECDLEHYRNIGLEADIESVSGTNIAPETGHIPPPATILDPDRKPRYISLAECIAIALEQGTIGQQNIFLTGVQGVPISNDNLLSFSGAFLSGDDQIRALALDPAIVESNIENSLSKFDARWESSLTWTNTDQPVGTAAQTLQAANSGSPAIELQDATLTSQIIKPLPTGGVAGITFTTAYELSNLAPRVNPSWRPSVQFQFEQPLLQGFGVEINQLRSTHPGSLLTPFPTGGQVEGILITRIRFDEQRAEFERNLNFMLVNVESAYWALYGAYWTLYSREQALRFAYESWRINKARYEAGRVAIDDFAQSRGQYELFRDQRITALGAVLEAERQLRKMMGLPVEDCSRLVPCDEPTLAPYVPDWCSALNEAVTLRPELVEARNDLKFRQLDLINQKNLLLPDLRFISTYDINALGSRLDTDTSVGALNNLGQNKFNNWSFGLHMDWPIGFRQAHANVRAARLNLARSYNVLRDQELKAQQFLALEYRHLFEYYANIEARRAQREAYGVQLEARFKSFLAGRGTLDFLLEAQRNWADALQSEYTSIVNYNTAIALFQFAKGTIMQYDSVAIGEGQLPHCAEERASEHQRQRTEALMLGTRAVPSKPMCVKEGKEADSLMKMIGVPTEMVNGPGALGLPVLPDGTAPSVPSLYQGQPPVPEMRESLPQPRAIPEPQSSKSPWPPLPEDVQPANSAAMPALLTPPSSMPPPPNKIVSFSGEPR